MRAPAASLPPGYRLEAHRSVGSTNALALEAARGGAESGLWVTAAEQTAGRGRRSRAWSSPPGNLYASLLLVDPSPPALAPTLSFVAAVALDRALIDCMGPAAAGRIALKWPNDLLGDGAKIAGILIEGELIGGGRLATVTGIGVNCVSHPEAGLAYAATDLNAMGFPVDRETLFRRLTWTMAEELATWNRGDNFAAVRERWLARAHGIGGRVRVSLTDREIAGQFETLDSAGRLVVRMDDSSRETIAAGDVFFGAPRQEA